MSEEICEILGTNERCLILWNAIYMITQSLSSALAPWNPISANVCGFLPPAEAVVGLGVSISGPPVGKAVGAESTREYP